MVVSCQRAAGVSFVQKSSSTCNVITGLNYSRSLFIHRPRLVEVSSSFGAIEKCVIKTSSSLPPLSNPVQTMKAFIEANFKMVDLNGDGIISGEEFRYNCITRIAVDDIKVVDEAFNRLMNVSPATHESRVLLWPPPPLSHCPLPPHDASSPGIRFYLSRALIMLRLARRQSSLIVPRLLFN